MANSFSFAGVSSSVYGVYVQNFPPIITGEERVRFELVPGRSGSLTILEGENVYDDIILPIECFVRDLTYLDNITAWLHGSGDLILGNDTTRYYKAHCINQLELKKVLRVTAYRAFTAVFRCKPYRYVYPVPATVEYTSSPGSITNPGTADAEPTIIVTGAGDITLTIGAKTVQIAALASAITIDVAAGLAYNGTTNLTGSLTGDWPMTIPPGVNAVSWTGLVSKVEIAPNWRYI